MENSIIEIEPSVQLTSTALIFKNHISFDLWKSVGVKISKIKGATHWWTGDWLNYGEQEWGEMYSQAIDETEFDYQTLRNDKWISNSFELSRRRDKLSFEHHKEVIPFSEKEQEMLLDKAMPINGNKRMNVKDFRQLIKEYKLNLLTSTLTDSFEHPNIDIRLGDATELIKGIANRSIDLIVVDPPYNIDKADWDSLGSGDEYALWASGWLVECKRILKDYGSIYIFGYNRMLSHLQTVLDGLGMVYRNWIIWDTIQGTGGGLWVNRYEAILYYSKTDDVYADTESVKLERHEENIREYGGVEWKFKNPSNIWRFPRIDDSDKQRTIHPTQKPIEMIERIVKASSPPGGTVLDPFIGSGTTAVTCLKNGRSCIGFENNESYYKIALDRLRNVV